MAKKNSYAKKAEQEHFKALTGHLDTKGSIKNTLIETGKDLVIGVIGGGLLGSAIGKPSLLIGIGVAGAGHYMGSRLLTLAGIGMMAANGFQSKTVNGPDETTIDGIKDRVSAFKDTFSEKLYLDKFLKKKTDTPVAGLEGDLQYFNYANEIAGLAALNSIEDQIAGRAMARIPAGDSDAVGEAALPAMDGVLADVSDYNL